MSFSGKIPEAQTPLVAAVAAWLRGEGLDPNLLVLLWEKFFPGQTRPAARLDQHENLVSALEEAEIALGKAGRRLPGREACQKFISGQVRIGRRLPFPVRLIHYFQPDYPAVLRHLFDPPPFFYWAGNREVFHRYFSRPTSATQGGPGPRIAVVGSRRVTPFLKAFLSSGDPSERLATLVCGITASPAGRQAPPVIISGLALGSDTLAHRLALASEHPTVAVLGNGLDRIYPRANAGLQRQLSQPDGPGFVFSEFPLGTSPSFRRFPRRNRLIAALAESIVVLEAPVGSGALWTVDYARQLNREIYFCDHPGLWYNRGNRRESAETFPGQSRGLASGSPPAVNFPWSGLMSLWPDWSVGQTRAFLYKLSHHHPRFAYAGFDSLLRATDK